MHQCTCNKLLGGMRRILTIVILAGYSAAIGSQPAEIEVDGVFGECIPVHAATGDELHLYREPDLRSQPITIPYQVGWRVEAPKAQGITRVLRIGSLKVIEPDDRMYCEIEPLDGPAELIEGEVVEHMYGVGEGYGAIRFRGGECFAQVHESFGHFEAIKVPEVMVWLRVFYADGTSPGWLLHDGSQTRVADVLC